MVKNMITYTKLNSTKLKEMGFIRTEFFRSKDELLAYEKASNFPIRVQKLYSFGKSRKPYVSSYVVYEKREEK